MNHSTIKKICLSAVMASLYVGLDFLAVTVSAPFGGTMKLSVSGLPVIIIASLIDPFWGMATGFVGALLGQMITYGFTPTTLLWVLPAVFRGLVFGLIFKALKKPENPLPLLIPTIISGLAVTAVNTFVLYFDSKIFHYPIALFGITLVNRIIAAVITAVLFAVVLPPITKMMKRVIKV